jgi:hypothetical protein
MHMPLSWERITLYEQAADIQLRYDCMDGSKHPVCQGTALQINLKNVYISNRKLANRLWPVILFWSETKAGQSLHVPPFTAILTSMDSDGARPLVLYD